jgi:acyl-CoA synthetase (AMP-forming)/AMP-acid ligase II
MTEIRLGTTRAATANIAGPLVEMAARFPDKPALIEPWGTHRPTPSGERRWTFRQLDDESDRIARGLERLGLKSGTRTALMVPPSLEFYALTFALFKLGAVVVLIDPGMGVKNLGVCLGEAEPEAFIGVPKAHLARILLGWAKKSIRLCVTVGRRWLWGGWALERVRREGQTGSPVLAATAAEEMAAILFTSGSTGVAKGVVYTHGIFRAQVEALKQLYHIEPGEVDLPTFPLFGLFGPALGMTAVIPEMDSTRPAKVDPRCILNAVKHYGVTNLFGSPALLKRVGFSPEAQGVKLETLRRILSAGAPVQAEVIRAFLRLLPTGVRVHTPYGATESLPVSSICSDEILGETAEQTDQGKGVCVGRPAPGMTVKIIRISDEPIPTWSDALELPAGQIGEIVVQGPVVTRSYHNRPEATALAKIQGPEGLFWHRMGDVGYFDQKGRIWFCGRKSQRVVTPAGTLFTIPCEGMFNALPGARGVFRTALVGVQRDGVTEPVLCVELKPSPDFDWVDVSVDRTGLRADLLAVGQKYPHTASIRHILFHPGFPVDIRHNAKIFREKLAAWASRQLK